MVHDLRIPFCHSDISARPLASMTACLNVANDANSFNIGDAYLDEGMNIVVVIKQQHEEFRLIDQVTEAASVRRSR